MTRSSRARSSTAGGTRSGRPHGTSCVARSVQVQAGEVTVNPAHRTTSASFGSRCPTTPRRRGLDGAPRGMDRWTERSSSHRRGSHMPQSHAAVEWLSTGSPGVTSTRARVMSMRPGSAPASARRPRPGEDMSVPRSRKGLTPAASSEPVVTTLPSDARGCRRPGTSGSARGSRGSVKNRGSGRGGTGMPPALPRPNASREGRRRSVDDTPSGVPCAGQDSTPP